MLAITIARFASVRTLSVTAPSCTRESYFHTTYTSRHGAQ
jgi:hypothetical protein